MDAGGAPARRKGLSKQGFHRLIWIVAGVFFVGGIALGMIFKTQDQDVQGHPIMVFDFFLMLSVWLAGLIVLVLIKAREVNRK